MKGRGVGTDEGKGGQGRGKAGSLCTGRPHSSTRTLRSGAGASQQVARYHEGAENYFRTCNLHAQILSAKCQMLNALL